MQSIKCTLEIGFAKLRIKDEEKKKKEFEFMNLQLTGNPRITNPSSL